MIVLVTGANRGIGLEVCRQLARRGYIAILTARDPVKAEHAAAKLQAEGLDIVPQQLDVTDAASVARARERVAGTSAAWMRSSTTLRLITTRIRTC